MNYENEKLLSVIHWYYSVKAKERVKEEFPENKWVKYNLWDKYVCPNCSFESDIPCKYCPNCNTRLGE